VRHARTDACATCQETVTETSRNDRKGIKTNGNYLWHTTNNFQYVTHDRLDNK